MRVITKYIVSSLLLFSSVCRAEQLAGEGAPQGIFSGYVGESIWTLVWFAVLLILLKKLAWKPLLTGRKAREEHISGEIAKAEQTNLLACEKLAEYEKKLSQIQQDNKKIVEMHLAEAKRQGNQIIAEARKEAELANIRAKEEINSSIKAARQTLWNDAGEIVCALGTQILSRTITPQDNKKLIEEAIENFGKLEHQQEE